MKLTTGLRPQDTDKLIIPDRLKNILFKDTIIQQNYIFHGTAGIGKTSAAVLLAKIASGDLTIKGLSEEPSICYIDATNDGVVDTIRDVLEPFCSSRSFNGKPVKTVIFDEFDRASGKFYDILKGFIEKYEDNVRFIATCNNISKIPDPILSRFRVLNFNTANNKERDEVIDKIKFRLIKILTNLKISFSHDGLDNFVSKKFPDIRTMYNDIQEVLENDKNLDKYIEKSFNNVEKNIDDLHRIVADASIAPKQLYFSLYNNYGNDIESCLEFLSTKYMYWMVNESEFTTKVPYILPKIQHYQSTKHLVPDPFLHTLSLILEIRTILFK